MGLTALAGVAAVESPVAPAAEVPQTQKQDRNAKAEPFLQRAETKRTTRRDRLYQSKHRKRMKIHPNRPWLH